jgi:phosphohistidine phosphatase SixA
MKNKQCNWCNESFETTISYQIYCSPECRAEATKEKILERYNQNKRKSAKHKSRKCKSCGGSLSVYNEEEICSSCMINPSDVNKALKEIRGIANE